MIGSYATIYRFFQQDYWVVCFYSIGVGVTYYFWRQAGAGRDPSPYINTWVVLMMVYAVFTWFKTGGLVGGGITYISLTLLSIVIINRTWRLRFINISLVIFWILIVIENLYPDLPVWGENSKLTYDYMLAAFVLCVVVARLKNNFDSQQALSLAFQRGLRRIYDLQALRHLPLNSLIEQYLLTGCEALNLSNGFVVKITEGGVPEVIGLIKNKEYLEDGDLSDIKQELIDTINRDELTLKQPKHFGTLYPRIHHGLFYAGLPIVINDETFGVIGFYDLHSQKRTLEVNEQELFELMQGNIESLLDIKYLKQSREEVDRALSFSEERFKSIYDHADTGICLTKLTGEIVMANHAMQRIYEIDEESLIGRNFDHFTSYEEGSSYELDLFDSLVKGDIDSFYYEKRNETISGKRIDAGITVSVIGDENGKAKFLVRIVNDITEQKSSEEKINALNIKLAEQIKELETANIELESFSYSVSHDLRAPLRAIDGYTRMIEDGYSAELDDEGNRLLQVISRNSNKMALLIEDLLEISKVSRRSIDLKPVDVHKIIQEVVFENNFNESLLEIGDLPVIQAEKTLIKQLFANLIGNAIKFSAKKTDPKVEVTCEEVKQEYVFKIKDNGVGFDMRRYDKIFGVFQRLHRADEFEGTGVGLAIVQKVAQKHKGRVWAESQVGVGSSFYFTIPRT